MSRLTLSVDDAVVRQAKARAAREGTSVSRIVERFLREAPAARFVRGRPAAGLPRDAARVREARADRADERTGGRREAHVVDWVSLLALACALAMDAFAVAVVTGLTVAPLTHRHVFRLAFHFGLFQALMPVVGWLAGTAVHAWISAFDHWVAFGLLALVGGRMLWGAASGEKKEGPGPDDPTSGWSLVVLSVATSIDALAVGLSLAMIGAPIVVPAVVIGVVAAAFTAAGMVLGRRVAAGWGKRVEAVGGLILIGIGVRIVVEHLSG